MARLLHGRISSLKHADREGSSGKIVTSNHDGKHNVPAECQISSKRQLPRTTSIKVGDLEAISRSLAALLRPNLLGRPIKWEIV